MTGDKYEPEQEPGEDVEAQPSPETSGEGKPTTRGGQGGDTARDAEAADSSAIGDGPSGGALPA